MSDRPKLHDVQVITAPENQPVSLRKLLADLGIQTQEDAQQSRQQAEAQTRALHADLARQVDRLEATLRQLKEMAQR